VTDVRSRVLIWFGEEDTTTPVAGGIVLRDSLADASLVLWPGEGHLTYKRHLEDIFDALVAA
jgi:pimeloyl-ACP methyl ester carboxylesterase